MFTARYIGREHDKTVENLGLIAVQSPLTPELCAARDGASA